MNLNKRFPWAVILAGGDGVRLRPLTRLLFQDDRPKQFCPIFGGQTLLGQTRTRVAHLVPPERTVYVVTRPHERFYSGELSDVERERLVVQPSNRGTAAAIVYSLLRIAHSDPEGVVAFLPADHHFASDEPLLATLASAFEIAAEGSGSIVLVGAEPEHPETEYGWIEPGASLPSANILADELARLPQSCRRVNRFWEKPSPQVAQELFDRGCLWNTFMMVGRLKTFLSLIEDTVPGLLRALEPLARCWDDPGAEMELATLLYKSLTPVDFSQHVAVKSADRLAVLCLGNAGWSDLGKPERVVAALSGAGIDPPWARALAASAAAN